MKIPSCLGFTLGLIAVAVGSGFAQNTPVSATAQPAHATPPNVDELFKPVTIGVPTLASTTTPMKLPAPYQVERAHRNFAGSGTSLLGPIADPLVDFLSWVDKLDKASRSPGGIPLSNGGILRRDDGNAYMIEPTNLFLRREHVFYGIAPQGPGIRIKF